MRVEPPTNTISLIAFFSIFASCSTCFTGRSVFLNKSALSSSNLARVKGMLKSIPWYSDSIWKVKSKKGDQ